MKKTINGFTIVELLIVIVVIAILAAISIVAYNGIQSRAKDAERQNDMGAIKKALELYYVDNSSYPTSNQIVSGSFRSSSLQASADNFVSPGGSGISYCWSASVNQYCYVGRAAGQSPDCTGAVGTAQTCSSYSLSYMLTGDTSYRAIRSDTWPN